jgi:hypothetical protein
VLLRDRIAITAVSTTHSANLTIIGRRFTVVISSAPSRPPASVARSRPADHARSTSSARSRPPIDVSLNPFDLSPNLFSRSTLGLGAHLILSPARLTASVSAHARVSSICFSASQPNRHTDARASPRRVHLHYTALSPDLRTASTTSLHCFLQLAALLLRCHLRRWLPRSPLCCALHSPGETGFSCSNRRQICDINACSRYYCIW